MLCLFLTSLYDYKLGYLDTLVFSIQHAKPEFALLLSLETLYLLDTLVCSLLRRIMIKYRAFYQMREHPEFALLLSLETLSLLGSLLRRIMML